jgi:hypothetical protein
MSYTIFRAVQNGLFAIWFLAGAKYIPLFQNIQAGCGAHPVPSSEGAGVFSRVKNWWSYAIASFLMPSWCEQRQLLIFTPLIKLNTVPNLIRQTESSIVFWSSSCLQFPGSAASVCWVGCYEWWRNASSIEASTPSLASRCDRQWIGEGEYLDSVMVAHVSLLWIVTCINNPVRGSNGFMFPEVWDENLQGAGHSCLWTLSCL